MTGFVPALLSLGVLAALLLITAGGWALITKRSDRLKAGLMVGAGAVLLVNMWLYSAPLPGK